MLGCRAGPVTAMDDVQCRHRQHRRSRAGGTTAMTASGRASHTGQVGRKATAQGNNSGRFVAFAPVSRAAASTERHTSQARPVLCARNAKSTAASAYTALNMSLARSAGLQQVAITRRQQPHPVPGHPRSYPNTRKHAKYQPGQQEKRHCVNQKQPAVRPRQNDQRRRKPLHAAGARIHTLEPGVNPMPLALRQPVQYARNPIGQCVVVAGRMNDAP